MGDGKWGFDKDAASWSKGNMTKGHNSIHPSARSRKNSHSGEVRYPNHRVESLHGRSERPGCIKHIAFFDHHMESFQNGVPQSVKGIDCIFVEDWL